MLSARAQGRVAVCLLAVLPLGSCVSTGLCSPKQRDVGEIFVAVQSVAAFEAYMESLQPKFTLTSDAAFEKAIPVTQLMEIERLRAVAASLRLALPVSTRTKDEVTKTENGETKKTSTETLFEGPGKTSDLAAPPQPGLSNVTPIVTPTVATPDVNIFLRYRAAAALLQEVSLLSSYVRDAAVRRGTAPYVVRLLVTVLPHRRETPYDAYATVTFVSGKPKAGAWPLRLDGSYQDLPDGEKDVMGELVSGLKEAASESEVEVVPLFVTDSVDSSIRSSTEASERGFDFSLGGNVGAFGAAAGAGAKARDARKSLGRPVSGSQTIGRAAKNALVVRLGADAFDDTDTLTARTYSVTALVLVPVATTWAARVESWLDALGPEGRAQQARKLDFEVDPQAVCKALNDPDWARLARISGIAADQVPAATRSLQLGIASLAVPTQLPTLHAAQTVVGTVNGALDCSARFEKEWRTEVRKTSALAVRLLEGLEHDVLSDRFRRRVHELASNLVPFPDIEYRWVSEFRGVRDGAATGRAESKIGGSFTLPPARFRFFGGDDFTGVFASDDGKATDLTVNGAIGLVPSASVSALLCRDEKKGCAPAGSVRSTSARVSEDGRSLSLRFPSLAKLPDYAAVARLRVELQYRPTLPSWSDSYTTTYGAFGSDVRLVRPDGEPKPVEPKVSLRVPVSTIRLAKEGHGEVTAEVRTKKGKEYPEIRVAVSGADLRSIDGGKKVDADFVAATNQILTLHLGNLLAGSVVTIEARTPDGESATGSPARVVVVEADEE